MSAPNMILALDPGTTETGWVLFDGERVRDSGVRENAGTRQAVFVEPVPRDQLPNPLPTVSPQQKAALERLKKEARPLELCHVRGDRGGVESDAESIRAKDRSLRHARRLELVTKCGEGHREAVA